MNEYIHVSNTGLLITQSSKSRTYLHSMFILGSLAFRT